MIIAVVNVSTLVSEDDAIAMTVACGLQLRQDLAPAWGIAAPSEVSLCRSADAAPKGAAIITLRDDPTDPGALGWHNEGSGGGYYGEVAARPSFDMGASSLGGSYAVSAVLSHELCELVCDPNCNLYVDGIGTPSGSCYAREVCDAVQAWSYPIVANVEGMGPVSVQVSDFVWPSWFDDAAVGQQVDHLGKAPGPFAIASGGYAIVRTAPGTEQQIFAQDFLKWRSPSRTARRLRAHQVRP